MRKKICFLVLIALMIFLPNRVNAGSVSVSLSCPSVVTKGQTISCKVNVTSDVAVTGLAAKYTFSNLTYVSFTPQNNFADYASSANGFAVGNVNGKTGTFTIGIVNLKVNGTGTFKLHSLDASDNKDNSYSPSSKTATLRVKSTNNSLKGISLSNGVLSPTFSGNVTSYTSTIDAGSVTINVTKGDSYQTVSGAGTKTLQYGVNSFKIVVKSESGTKKTYTIAITRPDNRSKVNTLKSLTLSSGTINFNSNTKKYNVVVDGNISKLKITSELTDSKSKYVKNYGNREVSLNYGTNTILIKVQAENKSINTYTITVTRKDNRSKINTLKSLTLSSGTIKFNSNTKKYDVVVDNDVSKIKITSVLTDAKSKYVKNYGNREVTLKYGSNTILMKVQAENGNINTYTINVTRNDGRSIVNTLESLTLSSGDIKFESNVTEYEIVVNSDVSKIEITSILTDEKAKYVKNYGDREVELKYGENDVSIKVQAENGSINTYSILVTRLTEEEVKMKDVTIDKIIVDGKVINDFIDSCDVEITKGKVLDIELSLTNTNATYEVIGNENLKDGSIVTIKVTSEDKSVEQEYKINVKVKAEEVKEDNNLVFVIIISIIVLIFAGLFFGYVISKKGKNKKKRK